MKKFLVTVEVTAQVTVAVKADDAEEAEALAVEDIDLVAIGGDDVNVLDAVAMSVEEET